MGAFGGLGFDTTVGEAHAHGWIWIYGDSPCRGLGMVHACGCEALQDPCRHIYVNAAFDVVLSDCTAHLAPSNNPCDENLADGECCFSCFFLMQDWLCR